MSDAQRRRHAGDSAAPLNTATMEIWLIIFDKQGLTYEDGFVISRLQT